MTRIIAGRFGGRRIATPRTEATRPTSDRAREALFSRLDHLGLLTGARVLDLFAGSGGLGFEALSRGAAHVTFVDDARLAVAALRENAQLLGVRAQTDVRAEKVARALASPGGEPYDVALLDPPYAVGDAEVAETLAALVPWLAVDAVVVVERSARSAEPAWPEGLAYLDDRRYGEATLWFAEAVARPAAE